MKGIGTLHPTEILPSPDVVHTIVFAAASSAHAKDWPTGAVGYTAGSNVDFFMQPASTYVVVPSSDLSTGSTAGHGFAGSSVAQELNPGARRIPPGSTGYSVTALSSGILSLGIFGV